MAQNGNEFENLYSPPGSPEQQPGPPKKPGRLDRINQRIAELERQKRAIQARLNHEQRKKRTRRLIQIGAIASKYLECPDAEPEEFEQILMDKLGLNKDS
jgi:hypothetical protein